MKRKAASKKSIKIAICTFPFVAADALLRMATSAQSQGDVWFYLSLHSQQPDVLAACEAIQATRPVVRFDYGYNRGLARSLNDAILAAYADGADVVINCNDDVEWGPGDVDRLAECALDRRDCATVSASGWHAAKPERDSMGYCAIAINPLAIETIGCFDENFFPAYWEDVDHHRRVKLAGLPDAICEHTDCHHTGSLSLTIDQTVRAQNDAAFRLNQAYWARKWGPNSEYQTPHNGGGTLRIPPENRRAPYGSFHDRPDLTAEPLEG